MPDSSPPLNAHLADAIEPEASLPVITAHEARLREWGPNPKEWVWTTSDYITSPDGVWYAIIGTDHGSEKRDHEPVAWDINPEFDPTSDPVAFETVKREIAKRGLCQAFIVALTGLLWPDAFPGWTDLDASDAWEILTAPLHVQCRAALSVLTAASRTTL